MGGVLSLGAQTGAGGPWTLESVTWMIEGGTRPLALEIMTDLRPGRVFGSLDDLERNLAAARQKILDTRLFTQADFSWTLADSGAQVRVEAQIKDTWSLLLLPYPKYDSNQGFSLNARLRDRNFLGYLQELRVNVDYKQLSEEGQQLGYSVGLGFPMQLSEHLWNVTFDHNLNYKGGNLLDVGARYTLGYDFQFSGQPWFFQFGQGFSIENSSLAVFQFDSRLGFSFDWLASKYTVDWKHLVNLYSGPDPDGYFNEDRFSLSSGYALADSSFPGGPIQWGFQVFAFYQYLLERPISTERQGLRTGLSQSLTWGTVNWSESRRLGAQAAASHEMVYNHWTNAWSAKADLSFTSHGGWRGPGLQGSLLWQDFFAFHQLQVSQRFLTQFDLANLEHVDMAALRGILNAEVKSNWGLFANFDLNLGLLGLNRLFGFPWGELQLAGFMDLGLMPGRLPEDYWGPLYKTVGAEALAFPYFARAYQVRASIGWNLDRLLETQRLSLSEAEIFFGLELHY